MNFKNLVSTMIGICLTIILSFTMKADVAMAAGVIHNGDPCFSNDYEGEWVIGDIAGLGAPETKICVRGTAKKSPGEFSVSRGDYCYEKSKDNKSYLSSVIEKNGTYGCGYPEPQLLSYGVPLNTICLETGGQLLFEDQFLVACQIPRPQSIIFEEACLEKGGFADEHRGQAVCFLK